MALKLQTEAVTSRTARVKPSALVTSNKYGAPPLDALYPSSASQQPLTLELVTQAEVAFISGVESGRLRALIHSVSVFTNPRSHTSRGWSQAVSFLSYSPGVVGQSVNCDLNQISEGWQSVAACCQASLLCSL